MKLLLDENLSPRLIEAISDLYPDSTHVDTVGFGSESDAAIWTYALEHGFAIVTKDSDYAERTVLEHIAPKVVWIRLGNCTNGAIVAVLRLRYEAVRKFLVEDEETCLELGWR